MELNMEAKRTLPVNNHPLICCLEPRLLSQASATQPKAVFHKPIPTPHPALTQHVNPPLCLNPPTFLTPTPSNLNVNSTLIIKPLNH